MVRKSAHGLDVGTRWNGTRVSKQSKLAQVGETGQQFHPPRRRLCVIPKAKLDRLECPGARRQRKSRYQLAPLRLVNRALCDAASDPLFYRAFACYSAAVAKRLPPFVAKSVHRLTLDGNGKIDFEDLLKRIPNLTSLDVPHYRAKVETLNRVMRELRLIVDSRGEVDFLSHLTNLECLEVRKLDHAPPIASLPRLRRLSLQRFLADPCELISALALSPCAGTLKALCLHFRSCVQVSPGWWAPLSGLVNLREFGLLSEMSANLSGDDIEAMASALADLPTLTVLDMKVPEALTAAVLRHGFPSNLKVLGISRSSNVEFGEVVAALPPDLSAFRSNYRGKRSAAVPALLARCPQLRALGLSFGDEAIEYLASGEVDRPLLLNCFWIGRRAYDALIAAGHRVDSFHLHVHWRIAGGLLINGEALAV